MVEPTNEQAELADGPAVLAREALGALVSQEPQRHPLVLGLVAPLGTALDPVIRLIERSIARFDYRSETVHMSQLLDSVTGELWEPLPARNERGYHEKRMDAGDTLRTLTGSGGALAALSISRIAQLRESASDSIAFVVRSLKHPDEVQMLRHVYGDAFSLLAVSSSHDERRDVMVDALSLFADARPEAERLIERDEADEAAKKFGQNVREVFTMADVYIPVAKGYDAAKDVDRFIGSLFGEPFLTPTAAEEAMKFAANASMRSAALGRQVGAALIPRLGTPVVAGTNEVPKPGGGQYWADDEPDHRDFRIGVDPNPAYIKRVLQDVLERLSAAGWLMDNFAAVPSEQLVQRALDSEGPLRGARLAALIEFTRCLHAEQAAIINAARAGVQTEGSVLYSTTFPCHECTKMIIGAGVAEVQYIEPYPKSLADRLFRDLINTEPAVRPTEGSGDGRVDYRPFQGIAPRRYELAFTAAERRAGDEPAALSRDATPRIGAWSETGVRWNEDKAIKAITTVLASLGAGFTQPGSGADGDEGDVVAPGADVTPKLEEPQSTQSETRRAGSE